MHTVVETPSYLTRAESVLDEATMKAIVDAIAKAPEAGDVMPGTGGFRKLRAA